MVNLDVTQRYLIAIDNDILRFILGVIGYGQTIRIHDRIASGNAGKGRRLADFHRNRPGIFRRGNNGIVVCLEIKSFTRLDTAARRGIGICRHRKASLFQLSYIDGVRIF